MCVCVYIYIYIYIYIHIYIFIYKALRTIEEMLEAEINTREIKKLGICIGDAKTFMCYILLHPLYVSSNNSMKLAVGRISIELIRNNCDPVVDSREIGRQKEREEAKWGEHSQYRVQPQP